MFHEKTICHGKFPKSNKFIRIYKKCRIHLLAVNLSLGRWFSRQQILSFSSVDIDMYHWIMFQTTFSKKLFKAVFSPGLTFFITAISTSYWWTLVCLDFSIVIYRFLLISCQCYWHCYNQKQSSESFLRKRCSYKFHKIENKKPVLESLFWWSCTSSARNFIKKETSAQMVRAIRRSQTLEQQSW